MSIADIKDLDGDGNTGEQPPEPDTSDKDTDNPEDNTNTQDQDTEETDDDTLQTSDQPDGDSETQPDEQPDTDAPSDDSQSTDDQNNEAQDADDSDQEQPESDAGDDGDFDLSEVSLPDNVDEPSNLSAKQQAKYYKEKFGNSTAEAQRLAERLQDATSFDSEDVPDDEELAEEYPNFHDLPQDRQDALRRTVATERKVNRIADEVTNVTQQSSRMDEAKQFAEASESLDGHEEDFAAYAAENGNESTDLDILAKAYMHDVAGNSSEPDQSSASKDPALNTGGSSQAGSTESDSNTITTERAQELRNNNPEKYRKDVIEGDTEIVTG